MLSSSFLDRLMRPREAASTRILFLAPYAPCEPDYALRDFPGDGGYPAYYHRVWSVLRELGYAVDSESECEALFPAKDVDLVFSLYNRMPIRNPEVFVSSLCAFFGLPCVGAAPNIRALAEDKWLSKLVARSIGIPVAAGAIYTRPQDLSSQPAFPGPYFVKNRFGAASEGVTPQSIQDDWAGAARIARALMERGFEVLVEAYMPGVDITIPVLGGEPPMALGIVRPGSNWASGILTEDLKQNDPLGYEIFEPGETSLAAALERDAFALWDAAGPMDYLRLDYRFDPQTRQRAFLEFNICCHIGRSGAICLAAEQWGMTQADVLGHVVEYSLSRQSGLRETRQ